MEEVAGLLLHVFGIDRDLEINGQLLHSAVDLYCQVWQEEPWNEFDWDIKEVIADLSLIPKKPGGILILAEVNGRVVGLTAGWQISAKEVADRTGQADLEDEYSSQKAIFYIAELCTDIRLRGRGIGTRLCEELFREATQSGFDFFILRTHVKAEPARRIYSGFGFTELPYADVNYHDRTYWVR